MRLPSLAPRLAVLLLGWLAMTPPARAAEPVQLLAAGSLRAAFTELTAAFRTAPGGAEVSATFGASGLLRQRIEVGAPADVFA
jgi:ABC-type molybdate transport system substrate-binding protein